MRPKHAFFSNADCLCIKVLFVDHGGVGLQVGSVVPPVSHLLVMHGFTSKDESDGDAENQRPVSESETGFTTRVKLGEIVDEALVWHDGHTTLVVLLAATDSHC